MITLCGFRPFDDIPIVFTGLRPGEKLYEELQLTGETLAKTRHPKIFIGRLGGTSTPVLRTAVSELASLAEAGNADGIRRALARLLPEANLAPTTADSLSSSGPRQPVRAETVSYAVAAMA
jgi:FlaA1/EpsC-like NDP-sugar epimerase